MKMFFSKKMIGWALSFGLSVQGTVVLAQSGSTKKKEDKKSDGKLSEDEEDMAAIYKDDAPPKMPTELDRIRECKIHDGKYIGYYEDVYKVENCTRRLVPRAKLRELGEHESKIQRVDSWTISAIPEGKPFGNYGISDKQRNCKDLEGKYVTHSFVDIFYVSNCRKRSFPDWATFLEHRTKRNAGKSDEILVLSWEEFSMLKEGRDMPSVVEENFHKQFVEDQKDVDLIPLDEACSGLNDKWVGYYSRIYKIEKCHKREVNASAFSRKYGESTKIIKLSSEQWLSLPDGAPIELDKAPSRTSSLKGKDLFQPESLLDGG